MRLTLNIGLNKNTREATLASLLQRGFVTYGMRVATGEWQGKPEETLVVECAHVCNDMPCVRFMLESVAMDCGQECVAVKSPEFPPCLVPPVAEFNESFWHELNPVTSGW